MTGAELRARRKALGLSQVELARRAEMSRDTVQYWERKAVVDPRQVGPRRFFEVLGMRDYQTLTRGDGVLLRSRQAAAQGRALLAAAQQSPVLCGAQTRTGRPCRMPPEPGRTRCKFHGGKSTGPRTPEGRATIAEAQRKRWAAWRAAQRPLS